MLLPQAMLGRWGVQTGSVGLFMSRRYGAMLLGYAAVLGLGRSAGPSAARTAILAGGAFVTGLVARVRCATPPAQHQTLIPARRVPEVLWIMHSSLQSAW
jgi:hypothetical protein